MAQPVPNNRYNPIHTDMIGGSWEYPEANYSYRETIWQAHVNCAWSAARVRLCALWAHGQR